MHQPPPQNESQYRKLDDSESAQVWDRYFTALTTCAKGICRPDHKKVRNGPCEQCVKTVRHVLETYSFVLNSRADDHAERQLEKKMLVVVQLHLAYKFVAGVLNPEQAVALDGYGPV